jgi:hypothetical protein
MSDLGRPVDILPMTSSDDKEKGVAEISDNAQKMDRTSEADPANINFVGLEPQLRDNVHRA